MEKLRVLLLFTIVIASINLSSAQETRTLKGKVISENFELLPGIKIHDEDTTLLGLTDIEGNFKIEVPVDTENLLLGYVAMEWANVKIEDCQHVEIIMMVDVIYDFISNEKITKKRKKRFKQLPKKHGEAYEKGIFKSKEPCVCYIFKE